MYFSAIAVSLYIGLLVANFALAGISHHINGLRPVWALAHMLNKGSAMLVIPAILIDLIRFAA